MGTKTKVFFAGLGGMLFGGLLVSGFSKSRYVTTLERGSSRLGRYEIDRVIVNGANMRVSYTAKLWPGLTRRWDAESGSAADLGGPGRGAAGGVAQVAGACRSGQVDRSESPQLSSSNQDPVQSTR